MFHPFLAQLRRHQVPVSLREYLTFLEGLTTGLCLYDLEAFYFFARSSLVKNEAHIDRFDQAFSTIFQGVEELSLEDVVTALDLPQDWLTKLAETTLTDTEKAEIAGTGSFEQLMETLRQRLEKQKSRHQGGNKWVGTAGRSPFGAYGYNPEGVRIGQDRSREKRAVKVWDRREFRNFDDSLELGTRNIKVALRRLRQWVRDGAEAELDLDHTIRASADAGYIDVKTRPERRNGVKLLLFLDVGGSMDAHVAMVDELFSALKTEFRQFRHFYFHNCLYEEVWTENRRRFTDKIPTWDILNQYGSDYRCIFVGDAAMSPYEIAIKGGANEHWNEETGEVWLRRARSQWPRHIWLNPAPERYWEHTRSTAMISDIFDNRMFPLTLEGITRATKALS
ncbi:VWA domain-containing protein [Thioclava sp. GXIMD2076]|uniref:vWA domain-containing protein n=1 Tax=Thioclava sp. GXIMD2076 TaxID=3131931 RepID=UPI0030CE5D06